MAIAFAIIGDVIPARERGRYQGYFGAVFGVSSVAGPLLGGWITDTISWRWIFYINLPIGIVALVVTSMALQDAGRSSASTRSTTSARRRSSRAVTSLLLYLNWAGEHFGWTSAARARVRCRLRSSCGRVRLRRAAGRGADHPDAAVPQPDLLGRQRLRLPDRLRDVRRRDLPAALLPDREGHVADRIRARDAADGGRHVQHVDRFRPAHHPDRQVQDLPDHRLGHPDRGALPAQHAQGRIRRTGTSRSTPSCSASGSASR